MFTIGLASCEEDNNVHFRIKTSDQYLSMGGNVGNVNFDFSNRSIKSFSFSNTTGQYRDQRIDLYIRGGSSNMSSQNFTEGKTTFKSDSIEVLNASVIDLRIKEGPITSEVYCIGSFSIKAKWDSIANWTD